MSGGKRWGECGTTQRWTRRPGFMSKTMFPGDQTDGERERIESDRLRRGLCAKCGRPLSVSAITEHDAQLLCGCGFRTVVKRGSRAYAKAALYVQMRGSDGAR